MWTDARSGSEQPSSLPVQVESPEVRPSRAHHFVLVEDSAADAKLFQRRLQESDPDARVSVVRDGSSAMEFLDDVIEGNVLRPDLLVLDLNLPVVKGWEILDYIKRSPLLRFLPVVILSSSKSPRDVDRAYHDGAAAYHHKGRDLDGFLRAVDAIHAYWLEIVDLPGEGGATH